MLQSLVVYDNISDRFDIILSILIELIQNTKAVNISSTEDNNIHYIYINRWIPIELKESLRSSN